MKNLKFLLACMLLTACVQTIETDFPSVNSKGEYAIQFGSKTTRASINTVSGTDYDQFNLYVWNSNNDTIMKPYRVEASGVGEYAYATLPNQELKYFSNTASSYYFTGVIPTTHKETVLGDTIKVDTIKAFTIDDARVTNTLIAESPEEFLYAYKKVDKVDYGNIVTLPFKHENALIYIGFSSDRDDTQLLDYVPGVPDSPETYDTVKAEYNVRVGASYNLILRAGPTVADAPFTQADVDYINSMFTLTTFNFTTLQQDTVTGNWPKSTSGKGNNPAYQFAHLIPADISGIDNAFKIKHGFNGEPSNGTFFNAYAWLKSKYDFTGVDLGQWATNDFLGNNAKLIVHLEKNDNNSYTAWFFDYSKETPVNDNYTPNSIPNYTIDTIPGVAGRQAIEGVRVFSADSIGVNNLPADTAYCVHIPHTMIADAYIDSTGCKLDNRVTSDSVIQFSLPTTTTLSATPVWSATTFYGLPGDANFNFIVVKLSYIYNGVTSYDVRVPIKLPAGGLQAGKYYKYEIKIQSTGNGTNDPDEATNEKDEILIEGLHPIVVDLQVDDYTQGANQQIKI